MNGVSKPWSDDYLRQAFADEIELAWAKLRQRYIAPTQLDALADLLPARRRGANLLSAGRDRLAFAPEAKPLPRWRRSWSAAGPLIGELGLRVTPDDEEGSVSVGNGNRRRDVTESYADHPNKDAAICAAIVRAAIRVCTEARELY
jgi:hypothetical protein